MRRLILVLVVVALLIMPVAAQTNTPLSTLQRYYDYLNQGDYANAYPLFNTSQSFYDYVVGFATTDYIQPYFGALQPEADGGGRVPTVLVAYQTSGTVVSFAGCMHMEVNDAGNWYLDRSNVAALDLTIAPAPSEIRRFITEVSCFDATTVIPQFGATTSGEPDQVLRAYVDALNDENFLAAYSMWLHPLPFPDPDGAPATDYRPAFNNFVAGYQSTYNITLYTGSYQYGGPSAGHAYLDGFMPVVLIGTENNGAINSFSGCFLMGRFTDGRLGIVNARLNVLTNHPPTADTIIDALNVDCTSLGIGT